MPVSDRSAVRRNGKGNETGPCRLYRHRRPHSGRPRLRDKRAPAPGWSRPIPRFYLHLRDGTDDVRDEEGQEFPDLQALRKAVLASARDVMGNDVRSGGLLDLRCRIDAETEAGQIVYSLPFRRALNIIPGEA